MCGPVFTLRFGSGLDRAGSMENELWVLCSRLRLCHLIRAVGDATSSSQNIEEKGRQYRPGTKCDGVLLVFRSRNAGIWSAVEAPGDTGVAVQG